LAVSLILGGFSGIAYAVGEHEPLNGEKLVGVGYMGTYDARGSAPERQYVSTFRFTNPDDSESITIKRVSIIAGDGTLIYEGPFVQYTPGPSGSREIITTMSPHQINRISLLSSMWTGDGDDPEDVTASDNWLHYRDAREKLPLYYTVEIA